MQLIIETSTTMDAETIEEEQQQQQQQKPQEVSSIKIKSVDMSIQITIKLVDFR